MAGRDTKTRIKEIGLNLFQERGFENVTINEICEQSGVNKHTFYYYFKSKDELLKDFYELPYDIGTEYFVQILNAENYVEQLLLSYNPFLEHISESGTEIARQLFIKNLNCDVGTFRINEKRGAMMQMQCDIIGKGQKAGEIRNLSLIHIYQYAARRCGTLYSAYDKGKGAGSNRRSDRCRRPDRQHTGFAAVYVVCTDWIGD